MGYSAGHLVAIFLALAPASLPPAVVEGTGATFAPHVVLGMDRQDYVRAKALCDGLPGNITGQVCNDFTECIGPGAQCPSTPGLFFRLCCCARGECCDRDAVCPGCQKSPCGRDFDPCLQATCHRYPDAACTSVRCGECEARFMIALATGNSTDEAVPTDVTAICHIPIPPTRDPSYTDVPMNNTMGMNGAD